MRTQAASLLELLARKAALETGIPEPVLAEALRGQRLLSARYVEILARYLRCEPSVIDERLQP